jgi:hypothetical protein
VAVVLVGFVPEKGAARPRPIGLAMAVGAGAMIGLFLVIIDRTPDDSGLAPLLVNRATSTVIMLAALAAILLAGSRRPPAASTETGAVPRWAERGVLLAVACGLVDAVANVLFCSRSGRAS